MVEHNNIFRPSAPINSANQDEFGLAPYALHLAEAIETVSGLAGEGQVVAINGPWGSGKTSLIELMKPIVTKPAEGEPEVDTAILMSYGKGAGSATKEELRNRLEELHTKNFRFFTFNAWMETSEEDISISLCNLIRDIAYDDRKIAKGADISLRFFNRNKLTFFRGLTNVASLAAMTAGLFGSVRGQEADHTVISGPDGKPNLEKEYNKAIKKLEKAIKALGEEDQRLIIVIDDIDRMPPSRINELFLALRWVIALFANVKITFLLLYDNEQVIDALARTMFASSRADDAQKDRESANLYLEKIVQFTFTIPQPPAGRLCTILERRLAEIDSEEFGDDHLGRHSFGEMSRWDAIRRHVLHDLIKTPRALNRLIGNYHFVEALTAHYRVDKRDLIALEALRLFNPTQFNQLLATTRDIAAGQHRPTPLTNAQEILAVFLPAHFLDDEGEPFEDLDTIKRDRSGFGCIENFDLYLAAHPSTSLFSQYDISGLQDAIMAQAKPDSSIFHDLRRAAEQSGDLPRLINTVIADLNRDQLAPLKAALRLLADETEDPKTSNLIRDQADRLSN